MPVMTLAKEWVRSAHDTEPAGASVTVDETTGRWLVKHHYVVYPPGQEPAWVHWTQPNEQ